MHGLGFYQRTINVLLVVGFLLLASFGYLRLQAGSTGMMLREQIVAADTRIIPDYELPPVQDGRVPVILRIPTAKPVVFLTLDDGMTRRPEMIAELRRHHIKASLFLNDIYAREDPAFFRTLVRNGSVIENHTLSHADLASLSYEDQATEICNNSTKMNTAFGHQPRLLRAPYGSYNDDTRRAAASCGMRALVQWHAKVNGGSIQYQDGKGKLEAGDIVLMHFRPEFEDDLRAFVTATREAGLKPQLLEDWLL
ncbi:MAG: chitooligosaccharide deacetylase [Candidatus Saccharibacteria bacterium]|nr:chitooligosaccharide deacetylase [Candidatus Saccharibacteria bacterium]